MHHVIPRCDDLQRRIKHVDRSHFLLNLHPAAVELGEVLQVEYDGETVVGHLADRVALKVQITQKTQAPDVLDFTQVDDLQVYPQHE